MNKTVCELFAGVGGFRLGLEQSSKEWETVWFSQWEPGRKAQWAHDCYVRHWGDINKDTGIDIAEVDKADIPSHSLLVGGFPCQNYSVAASKSSRGIEGEKGVLWWQIRNVLIAKRPPFVLLENVDRLLKSPAAQRGRDFGIMLTCFAQLGYQVEWRVINAADYGAAQRRRRIFIFAYDKDTNYYSCMEDKTAKDIVAALGFFAKAFPIGEIGECACTEVPSCRLSEDSESVLEENGLTQSESQLLEVSKKFRFSFENAGYMKDGKVYTYSVAPEYEASIILGDILEHSADKKYFIPVNKLYYTDHAVRYSDETEADLPKECRHTWQYLKGGKRRNRKSKTGHEYIFSEGPISMIDEWENPARTMLTSEGSFNRSTHIVRDKESGRIRLLTPVEAERIQGFPDDWTKECLVNGDIVEMPETKRFFCMGNALVVPMVKRMGQVLNEIIEAED